MEKIKALLDEYGLSVNDLTADELKEIKEEAKERDEHPDWIFFDGYFGSPMPLMNIKFRKEFPDFTTKK